MSRRDFATCLSGMRVVLLVSCVFGLFAFPSASMEGLTLVRAEATVAPSDGVDVAIHVSTEREGDSER